MSTQSDSSIPSHEWALTLGKTLHQTPVFDEQHQCCLSNTSV